MEDNYLTVSALTKYIKRKFTTDPHLKNLWLKGEISNFKHHSRGHMYLTIKDDNARVQAVMFAGNNRRLKFQPENGMNVLIRGDIGVFEQFGQYQLYIQQMEPDGIGSLYLAFEQLKEKLSKKGYFDEQRKKELPKFPEHIGIITSPTGAAVRDIITTIKRRYPIVQTTIIPVLVQGENAPSSIAGAINKANQITGFDVLIVGRGGGSIEELWGFNEEIVANAIYNSQIPVVSAVGHETDMTISDFAADVRAPTPTGAAEIAVPSTLELLHNVSSMQRSLTRIISEKTATASQHLNRIKQSYAFRYPEQLIAQKEQELDKYVERLGTAFNHERRRKDERLSGLNARLEALHPRRQIERTIKDLKQLNKQLNYVMTKQLEQSQDRQQNSLEKLTLLNPLETMKRGYAITYSSSGKLLKTVKDAAESDEITVKLSDGKLVSRVLDIEEEKDGEG
ncbi:exodeoxyribonuclease VII large subunit [Lentibacillus amyloliquefaciens]|uniref:Exodeoxyribonuclease 7 large subunit n=1 Tax=Lentibacillus amyloliquefaciens TaxID=1472767 RepID=A0A0U4EBV1_9BACI|nr:exodeoxyribonuclease VII large subunit [Lentibacillus amyloliquefaciens]ALX48041.1 exodeoxyribonuclease VII large subunit [Lentibacillus amyloliquefaciens]